MEFIVLLIIMIIMYVILRVMFDVNAKRLKQVGVDKELDDLTQKYPENVEICKWYLKKLKNESVNIQEDCESNSTLYLVMSNKIFIADLKNSFTRIQTIAHECLHSVQNKRLLWFNFVFSNIYLLYFAVVCVLALLNLLPCEMLFVFLLLLFGFVYYAVRVFLENDAMIKARFLAKDYMVEVGISSEEEIARIVDRFDELNELGIRFTNFKFLESVLIKSVVLILLFIL